MRHIFEAFCECVTIRYVTKKVYLVVGVRSHDFRCVKAAEKSWPKFNCFCPLSRLLIDTYQSQERVLKFA